MAHKCFRPTWHFFMKQTLIFASALFFLASSAQAQRPTLGPAASDGEAAAAWIAQRVSRARTGHRDLVRLPLVFQSDGWGCTCPTHYLGTDPNSHEGGATWLKVENESGIDFPQAPNERIDDGAGGHFTISRGMVVRVDGYFTGDVERGDYDGEPYDLNVFVVTRIHNRMRRPDNARVALIRTEEVAICERIVDDRTPLNVRARPNSRANVVGTLPSGTRIRPVQWHRHRWIRIEGDAPGWVWVDSTRRACD